MKNLIIHPQDPTTDFLKPIYEQVNNKTIITHTLTTHNIKQLIKTSDRIMMMGHGTGFGLLSFNLLPQDSEILDKPQNVYIWCNADKFIEKHNLHGFYSGMFISEVSEARFCGLKKVTQEMITESNDTFSEIVGKYIHLDKTELYTKVIKEYGKLAKTNPVAAYNLERLYVR